MAPKLHLRKQLLLQKLAINLFSEPKADKLHGGNQVKA